jgi:hypothetical protein
MAIVYLAPVPLAGLMHTNTAFAKTLAGVDASVCVGPSPDVQGIVGPDVDYAVLLTGDNGVGQSRRRIHDRRLNEGSEQDCTGSSKRSLHSQKFKPLNQPCSMHLPRHSVTNKCRRGTPGSKSAAYNTLQMHIGDLNVFPPLASRPREGCACKIV